MHMEKQDYCDKNVKKINKLLYYYRFLSSTLTNKNIQLDRHFSNVLC